MRKFLFISTLFGTSIAFAQSDELILTDTIKYVTEKITSLDSWLASYEAFRLNYEDCNLEVHRTDTQYGYSTIYSFWLFDLDETEMKLEYIERFGTWSLKFKTIGNRKSIKQSPSVSIGNVSEFALYANEKEPLLDIGKALYFAIRSCKGLDRFKK